MVSIRSLLDTFGPPPREICLDWAWQIRAAATSLASLTKPEEAGETVAAEARADRLWTSLEVASDGLLDLQGLSPAMAVQATLELREWLTVAADSDLCLAGEAEAAVDRDIDSCAETFGVSASLSQSNADYEPYPSSANRKRSPQYFSFSIKDCSRRLTLAGVLLAPLGTLLLCVAMWQAESVPIDAKVTASLDGPAEAAPDADGSPQATAGEDDFLAAQDSGALASGWTTSAELTGGALNESTAGLDVATATAADHALRFSPSPSLSTKSPESPPALPATASGTANANVAAASDRQSELGARTAPPSAPTAVEDVLSQVAAAAEQAEQAEMHSSDDATDAAVADGSPNDEDWTRQAPLMLARDANFLRPAIPRGLVRRIRDPQWTARVELVDGFVSEPLAAQTVASRTGAQWRIYDKEAKSPRACLIVSVRWRSGRDFGLEWSLRGGAEDLPELRLPVDRKWLDTLATQLKNTATSLRSLVAAPTQTAPRELRPFLQNQRQIARRQLELAERLIGLLAEVDHLASLLDGEVLCHAELRESAGGALLLAYGSCEDEPAPTPNPADAPAK